MLFEILKDAKLSPYWANLRGREFPAFSWASRETNLPAVIAKAIIQLPNDDQITFADALEDMEILGNTVYFVGWE